MDKERLDKLLVKKGLVESRQKAQGLILSGRVWVENERIDKVGTKVPIEASIVIKGSVCPYVSRGGLKLEKALKEFKINVKNQICADIGASTGGFTDCLLQHGARRVYALDVGKGQLHWKLRNDPRVIIREKFNARYLKEEDLPEKVSIITIDVSFISLKKIIPATLKILKNKGKIVALIKPQFEVGPKKVGKGGIVRDPKLHKEVIEDIIQFVSTLGLNVRGLIPSPILGAAGNKEFLIYLQS